MYDVEKTRALNDAFRKSLLGGRVLVTRGVSELPDTAGVLERVRTFNDFTRDDDPYREHDFGSFTHDRQLLFWKIDYYDPDMLHGSPDPTDVAVTTRVLTVMLAEEY